MEEESEFDYTIKLLIVGDSSVGKTNIMYRFIEKRFSQSHMATTGMDVKNTAIDLKGKKIKLQLWDTAGQEKYRSITRNLFLKVQGFLLVYDITNRDSYENLGLWIKLIRDECGHMPIIILGNKNDLEEKRAVTIEEAQDFAKDNKIDYIETSSKSGENIAKAINLISEKVLETSEVGNECSFTLDNSRGVEIDKKKGRCCSQ